MSSSKDTNFTPRRRSHTAPPAPTDQFIDITFERDIVATDQSVAHHFIAPFSERLTIEIRDYIAGGKHGDVFFALIDGQEYVLKAYRDEKVFHHELSVYQRIQRIPGIAGQVPNLRGTFQHAPELLKDNLKREKIAEHGLVLQHFSGKYLIACIEIASQKTIDKLWTIFSDTMDKLLRYGILHGDPDESNCLVAEERLMLIDFSQAVMLDEGIHPELAPRKWKERAEYEKQHWAVLFGKDDMSDSSESLTEIIVRKRSEVQGDPYQSPGRNSPSSALGPSEKWYNYRQAGDDEEKEEAIEEESVHNKLEEEEEGRRDSAL